MRHTCPDGTSTRLVRDDLPVGVEAPHRCPRCHYVFDSAELSKAEKALRIGMRVKS